VLAIIEEAVKTRKMVWVPGSNKQQVQVPQGDGKPPVLFQVDKNGFRHLL
jgi:hypothetical protein